MLNDTIIKDCINLFNVTYDNNDTLIEDFNKFISKHNLTEDDVDSLIGLIINEDTLE